jgi:hypothetical protein
MEHEKSSFVAKNRPTAITRAVNLASIIRATEKLQTFCIVALLLPADPAAKKCFNWECRNFRGCDLEKDSGLRTRI